MKKTKILYWTFTGLFSALMLFASIPDILVVPDAVTFMANLGYPKYFIPFIGIAKLLGIIAILIPGFPRIKEWAYAGLFFDLIGATYSQLAIGGPVAPVSFMLVPIVLGVLSYVFYHKKLSQGIPEK
jgi:DoxX-like family